MQTIDPYRMLIQDQASYHVETAEDEKRTEEPRKNAWGTQPFSCRFL